MIQYIGININQNNFIMFMIVIIQFFPCQFLLDEKAFSIWKILHVTSMLHEIFSNIFLSNKNISHKYFR